MMRTLYTALLWLLVAYSSASAQNIEDVETEIRTSNQYDLSIIRVYPDSFPQVSAIFQAENELGMPIWEMDVDELTIEENGIDCELLSIRNISKEIPLNIGLVLDASGSMSDVSESEFLAYYGEHYRDSVRKFVIYGLPFEYEKRPWTDAMDHAKQGLRTFLTEESLGKDSIQLVVFSHQVRVAIPLTSNHRQILEAIDSVVPMMNTAFYDAVVESLNMIESSGDKTVIVALTDGMDNESSSSVRDVIALANERNVKVFIIGLGNVFKRPLEEIADKTGGEFHYTDKPEQLSEIYRTIKKKIKSVYEVRYLSEHDDINDSSIDVQFSFVNDTLTFLNGDFELELPQEALDYIKRRDKIRQMRNVMIPVGIVSLIGFTVFAIRRRKNKTEKKEGVVISKVYPNPFRESFSIDFQSGHEGATITDVLVFDERNQMVQLQWNSIGINQVSVQIDKPNPGLHLVMLQTLNAKSQPVKIICKI
jgi:hypothetical protein